ncbi:MAG: hypothetical protein ACRCX2_13470 [Paraclostridium sp.]
MSDCCNIKKVATVTVYENKNEVKHHGYMAGDRNTPVLEVIFRHFWDIQTLKDCKLRWVLVDDTGSLVVGETSISGDNKASIPLPNELFNGERRMKVQLTVASCDGARILNLQQITDLKVISSLATNEVVEPVYGMLINGIYDETQKCIESIKAYLLTTPNGGNAEYLRGYEPSDFLSNKKEADVNSLSVSRNKYVIGDIVDLNGYYIAGDGAHHKRKIEGADDGSGVQLANGLWANIVHNGEVNVSWFGVTSNSPNNQALSIQKFINYCAKNTIVANFILSKSGYFYINTEIKIPEAVPVVKFSRTNTFRVASDGVYDKGYAIQFGENTGSAGNGRAMFSLQGSLFVHCTDRNNKCNGVYIKGAWITSEYIRATNFNGTGVLLDSVWDSTFTKISVERCGNSDSYAFRASSQGDTFNCTHIVSLQVEHSYNRALQLMLLRALVSNIHCERLHTDESFTGVTHHLDLTASMVNQGQFSSSTGTGRMHVELVLVSSSMNCCAFNSDISGEAKMRVGRGWNGNINNCSIPKIQLIAPLKNILVQSSTFDEVKVESGNFYRCQVGTFLPTDNAFNIVFDSGEIDVLNFEGIRSRGQIRYNNSYIKSIERCCDRPKVFNGCFIDKLSNHWMSKAILNNCTITDVDLEPMALYDFKGCEITNWSHKGNTAHTTRDTRVVNQLTPWTEARNYKHPAGTITERTDSASKNIVYWNNGKGFAPNPDNADEIISPWQVISKVD